MEEDLRQDNLFCGYEPSSILSHFSLPDRLLNKMAMMMDMGSTIWTSTKANLAIATADCPTHQKKRNTKQMITETVQDEKKSMDLQNSTGSKQTGWTAQLQTCATLHEKERQAGTEDGTKSPEGRAKSHQELFPDLEI